jgi:hypothetical protein
MKEKESGRFFEKKLRKKLLLHGGVGAATSHGPRAEVFWSFFSKKDNFL